MADRFQPVPQPAGALGPPDRHPPTAVGVATPPPPPNHGRPLRAARVGPLRRALDVGLHAVRQVAAAVGHAAAAGMRGDRTSHGRR